ncbi:MAG: di-trans,poly-cis-decaprenylcistransferase [Hydrogenophilales bacterium 12-61-10]|nr:MAG: di-trans,poly-cis-decaprenylcistransferase [Hydrogenophilales bacterium 12-61-10]OYX27453.1 MAG: di-trans,poly-cis-decaprenylcistransferase [Hydrogenophilales bacterium 32-62-9]
MTRSKKTASSADVPRHIAIIMDGNGRWAKRRLLPRVAGHRKGVETLRDVIRACADRGVAHLTVFAFSSENWRRPQEEVTLLMELFMRALENEVTRLHENNIRFRLIGDLSGFSERIQTLIRDAEALTSNNTRLTFTVAANYGGRWDIVQAVKKLMSVGLAADDIDEAALAQQLSLSDAPEPDLFIRTGGEKRISNFLMWQLAYTELYFTDALWPDFNAKALDEAIESYRTRERRFGRTSEQVQAAS